MACLSMLISFGVLFLLVPASLALRCPASVSSFSAGASSREYYTCTSERVAVLKSCSEGQIYSNRKKGCSDNLEEPELIDNLLTLGRSVRIGTLYDHRTGMFFPEANIWNVHDHNSNSGSSYDVKMV